MKKSFLVLAIAATLSFGTSIGYSQKERVTTEQPQLHSISSNFP